MNPQLAASLVIWTVLGRLDSGSQADMAEVSRRVEDGSLFRWLQEEHGLVVDPEVAAVLLEEFSSLQNAVDPGRKFNVRQNGLALVLAWCIEIYQQGLSRSRT